MNKQHGAKSKSQAASGRRDFLKTSVAGAVGAALAPAGMTAAPLPATARRPNIIYIHSHDTGRMQQIRQLRRRIPAEVADAGGLFVQGSPPVRPDPQRCETGNASSGNRGSETCRHEETLRGCCSHIPALRCRNTSDNRIGFRPGRPNQPRSWLAGDRGTMKVFLWWRRPLPPCLACFDAARNSPKPPPRFGSSSRKGRT